MSPPRQPSGIWRGTVARVTAAGSVYVTVDRLTGVHEFGPVTVAQGPWTPGLSTSSASAHSHGLGEDLAAGDRVLVAFVEGRANDVVVLARLP